jgi:CubicO group peptidase (beta-lactamase class C family)
LRDQVTAAQTLAAIARVKRLGAKPGTYYDYQSSNYFLMKVVVERIVGEPFAEYVKARIFTPLGMTSTSWYDHSGPPPVNEAIAYLPVGRLTGPDFDPYDFPWDVVGGGGLQTTARDLQKWAQNFTLPLIGGEDFLASQLKVGLVEVDDPKHEGEVGYAGGLRVWQHHGRTFYLHGGGWDDSGFRAMLLMDLVDHVAVSMTCNLATIDPYTLGIAIYDAWREGG